MRSRWTNSNERAAASGVRLVFVAQQEKNRTESERSLDTAVAPGAEERFERRCGKGTEWFVEESSGTLAAFCRPALRCADDNHDIPCDFATGARRRPEFEKFTDIDLPVRTDLRIVQKNGPAVPIHSDKKGKMSLVALPSNSVHDDHPYGRKIAEHEGFRLTESGGDR